MCPQLRSISGGRFLRLRFEEAYAAMKWGALKMFTFIDMMYYVGAYMCRFLFYIGLNIRCFARVRNKEY